MIDDRPEWLCIALVAVKMLKGTYVFDCRSLHRSKQRRRRAALARATLALTLGGQKCLFEGRCAVREAIHGLGPDKLRY